MADAWVADTRASEKYPVFTRANASEVAPHPLSPLGSSMVFAGPCEHGFRDSYIRTGAFTMSDFEDDRNNVYNIFGGYLYLSISLARVLGARIPGLTPEMVDDQYYGAVRNVTPYEQEKRPTDINPQAEQAAGQWISTVLATTSLTELADDRLIVQQILARRPNFDELSDQGLVDYARSFLPLSQRLMSQHVLITVAMGFALGGLGTQLATVQRADLLMTLVAGLGEVDSAGPTWAMWDLSRLGEDSAEYKAAFTDFIAEHGFRGANEWDLVSKSWGMAPEPVIRRVRSMRSTPDQRSPAARQEANRSQRIAAADQVRKLLSGQDEPLETFNTVLRSAQLFSAGRERTKHNSIAVVDEQQRALWALAARAQTRGVISDERHLFMLVERELDGFVADPESFGSVLAKRSDTFAELAHRQPPFVTHGAPPHWTEWPIKDSSSDSAAPTESKLLRGIAGAPGKVTGPARIVLNADDDVDLEPGEILIAPYTDPSWTPLFISATAVVVNIGSQITHAVIVSREMGLPGVVSAADATRVIPEGAMVEVDGNAGTVTIVE